jgi:uncharacterized membrane protein YcaP (DUF421 family)
METVLRVAYVYILLMLVLRVMGKRELGRLSPFELVLLMLIPELFSQALVREDFSMTNATVAFTSLVTLVFATSVLAHRFKRLETLFTGHPAVLVSDGRFVQDAMNEELVQPGEVYSELRKAGYQRLSDAKWVILENDGKLSIVPMEQNGGNAPRQDDGPV